LLRSFASDTRAAARIGAIVKGRRRDFLKESHLFPQYQMDEKGKSIPINQFDDFFEKEENILDEMFMYFTGEEIDEKEEKEEESSKKGLRTNRFTLASEALRVTLNITKLLQVKNKKISCILFRYCILFCCCIMFCCCILFCY
jgi:hypothetical protein